MKRYGPCVLNYIITSSHIHLLVRDRGQGDIKKNMQLVAGRTAREYNQRKGINGAFWEDRYHATAVDSEMYLARYRSIVEENDAYDLKETVMPYATHLKCEFVYAENQPML